eukprot:TRINITY_DN76096_c0_g1_i1.p1 TRINITY_DN76096_c0_g1~~TRINITY_DN76096_c0_g1_i1.p1  ORF type:complete len:749 (-),score=157.85 TRINITY_DN76096_c0_g1_i1:128-2335(-)
MSLVEALTSAAALLRRFPGTAELSADSEAANREVQGLNEDGRRQLRAPLQALLASKQRLTRSASSSSGGGETSRAEAKPPLEAWLPLALAISIPLLSGALPRDERGLCVVPHQHKLKQRRLSSGRRIQNEAGCLVYNTKRACDNCDKPIEDRTWFACAEGCEVDFCSRCHRRLEQTFEGRDVELAAWAGDLVGRVAELVLRSSAAPERLALIRLLAFEWPLGLFQELVRAVADVADARVVHRQDGSNCDIAADSCFWQVLGLLQLLRLANELPAQEVRFGELTLRGPRIPISNFVLGAIDKCDASAEVERWQGRPGGGRSPEQAILEDDTFEVAKDFAVFLAHGCLVPIGFRRRCLKIDAEDALMEAALATSSRRRRAPLAEIHIEVPRAPDSAVLEAVVATLGQAGLSGMRYLAAEFTGETGKGPGVTREFLGLAVACVLKASSKSGSKLWEYNPILRTVWLGEPASDAQEAAEAACIYRSCGVLLGQAVLTGTLLQVAFPCVFFGLLLRAIGSKVVPEPGLPDLATIRPELAKGLQDLLEYEGDGSVADIFSLDWPCGEQLTLENRASHVQDYLKWFFNNRHESQLAPLHEGFRSVLGKCSLLKEHVSAAQLEQILCGAEEPLDVEQVRLRAEAVGWSPSDAPYLDSFWEVLAGLDGEQRRRFALFVSACDRRPPQGWHDFELKVQKNGSGDDRLPTAYTCFNLLLLPRYSSPEVLRSRLLAAAMETEGFGLR